jgi:TrmH family RNA methyltransferase
MKTITSRDNAQYKDLKHLATSSQARKKAGQTLLDGVHLCEAYLELRGLPVQCIVSESALTNPEVAGIVGKVEHQHGHTLALPDALYNAVSQVEHGVGVMFLIDTPERAVPDAMTVSAVLLDNVQDPGNVGSILRSAAKCIAAAARPFAGRRKCCAPPWAPILYSISLKTWTSRR